MTTWFLVLYARQDFNQRNEDQLHCPMDELARSWQYEFSSFEMDNNKDFCGGDWYEKIWPPKFKLDSRFLLLRHSIFKILL